MWIGDEKHTPLCLPAIAIFYADIKGFELVAPQGRSIAVRAAEVCVTPSLDRSYKLVNLKLLESLHICWSKYPWHHAVPSINELIFGVSFPIQKRAHARSSSWDAPRTTIWRKGTQTLWAQVHQSIEAEPWTINEARLVVGHCKSPQSLISLDFPGPQKVEGQVTRIQG